MSANYASLCSSFTISQQLGVKMDLPMRREPTLDLFERLRKEFPRMDRFRRYEDELALESPARSGDHTWVALRKSCVRSGCADPRAAEDAHRLNRRILETAPYFLGINALDVDYVEATYAFDFDASGNHHAIIHDALLADSPLGAAVEGVDARPIDVQPGIGFALSERCDVQGFIDVKARTTVREIRQGRYNEDAINVSVTVRKYGAVGDVGELPGVYDAMTAHVERLVEHRVASRILQPIRSAIASYRA